MLSNKAQRNPGYFTKAFSLQQVKLRLRSLISGQRYFRGVANVGIYRKSSHFLVNLEGRYSWLLKGLLLWELYARVVYEKFIEQVKLCISQTAKEKLAMLFYYTNKKKSSC